MKLSVRFRCAVFAKMIACSILLPSLLLAQKQDNVKAELFREVNAAIEQARCDEVPALAPTLFPKALALHERADKEYEKGEKVKKIRERLDAALQEIKKIIEVAKVSRVALADLLSSLQEAAKREYINLAPTEFGEAERKHNAAVLQAEAGDLKAAKEQTAEAIQLYREMTIKTLLEGPIKNAEAQLK